jgi:hypothetical protein
MSSCGNIPRSSCVRYGRRFTTRNWQCGALCCRWDRMSITGPSCRLYYTAVERDCDTTVRKTTGLPHDDNSFTGRVALILYRSRGCHWWRGRTVARRRVTPRIVRDDDTDDDDNTSIINCRTKTRRDPFMVTTPRAMRPLRDTRDVNVQLRSRRR